MNGSVRKIPLSNGKVALVDEDVSEDILSHSWNLNENTYVTRNRFIDGKWVHQRLHRLIMGEPEGMEVDHINGDKLDNRRENLRVVTRAQNSRNRPMYKTNQSGYKGVYLRSNGKTYQAQIRNKGKLIQLGTFDNPHDAARMYNFWALDLFGEFARLNVINE